MYTPPPTSHTQTLTPTWMGQIVTDLHELWNAAPFVYKFIVIKNMNFSSYPIIHFGKNRLMHLGAVSGNGILSS